LLGELNSYCDATPKNLDPEQVLTDPRWEAVRSKAGCIVAAFESPLLSKELLELNAREVRLW
jgi:hypothetical protein